MALNSSGPISLAGTTAGQSIEVELGGTGTTQISLNDASVRTLAGVASGAITMPTNFWGKSNRPALSYTFSANTANASLNVTSISGYVAGKSDITITVNTGVYLYATSTGNAGLTLTGGTTGDTITLVNNGYIMGQGGQGGSSQYNGSTYNFFTPTSGGTALSLGFATTINNTNASAYIGGGGGGGGLASALTTGGGGAGGGLGGTNKNSSGTVLVNGGTGGSVGASGGNGNTGNDQVGVAVVTGGGGGRIFAGTGGSSVSVNGSTIFKAVGLGGGSGASGAASSGTFTEAAGGGGGWGASGGSGLYNGVKNGSGTSGAGGSANASGGNGSVTGTSTVQQTGASGGKAVALNGYSVTWVSGNTTRVYGAVA